MADDHALAPAAGRRTGDFAAELAFVLAFATEAVGVVHELRRSRAYEVDTKADESLVSSVDRYVNSLFIEAAGGAFPLDRVLGEEQSRGGAGPRTWVIDPIDGTEQFVLGIPTFMISIALTDGAGQPVVACAVNPSTREVYHAVRGGGAFRDGEQLHVSVRDGVRDLAIVRGSGAARRSYRGLSMDGVLRVRFHDGPGALDDGPVHRRSIRPSPMRYAWPSVFSGCKVAEGSWDADLYYNTAAHDVAATALLVTEAGGRVTDREGNGQRYDRSINGCILSNGLVHDALVRHWWPEPEPDARR